MKKTKILSLVIALAVFSSFSSPAVAELLVNPINKAGAGQAEAGSFLTLSEVEYEYTWITGNIERKILGGYVAYGVNEKFDIYGSLGYIFTAEMQNWHNDDSGFTTAVGIRGLVHKNKFFSVMGYGQYQYVSEEYGNKLDGTFTELTTGGMATRSINNNLDVYGGGEIILYSDGDISTGTRSVNVERDSRFSLKGGAVYGLNNLLLRGEITVGSESTFTMSIGFPL